MDAREQRGSQIAEQGLIRRKGDQWVVPSQSNGTTYTVDLFAEDPTCTCQDYETRRGKCKHIHAVEFTILREENPDDGTVTIMRVARVTYRQNWPAYNMAQTKEREQFGQLLRGLCEGVTHAVQGKGRPRHHLADVIFAMVWRAFSCRSLRRMMGELYEWHARGFLETVPHYNTIQEYVARKDVKDTLDLLIDESSSPLQAIEDGKFAIDSSGFTTANTTRWFDERYGRNRRRHEWLKIHLMCSTRTHVITAVEVTGANAADAPLLPALVEGTADRFPIQEVAADKAYLSRDNLRAIASAGGLPYIPFKTTSAGGDGATLWRKLFH